MITQTTQNFILTAQDASSSEADIRAAAQSLLNEVPGASAAEANESLSQLARYISLEDSSWGAFIALVCGAMVENGCDPAPLTERLVPTLKSLLESSTRLAEV